MILLNDFYTIVNRDASDSTVRAKIFINRTHKIFEGHFPGLPIVPGVCMMQIIREIMEVATEKSLMITGADNMKFLSVINPDQNPEVDVSITYSEDSGTFNVNASLFAGTVTFFKLKAALKTS
jgi:3-hydroxyacyl-[acyl-carrier-protein] dehydratase